jgi:adenylylsulfate kinase-like enzyme
LLSRNGVAVITAAISPYRDIRNEVRQSIESDGSRFIEVFVKCPIDVLAKRDVKGLYKKALAGEIVSFTGVSDPYQEPVEPEIVVETDRESIEQSVATIISELTRRRLLTQVTESSASSNAIPLSSELASEVRT